MIYLRQSTASQEVPLGPFIDSTDGDTEKTALTIGNTDIKVWKNGATTLANKNSGGATHISNGIYYAVLDATDTDTIGSLVLFIHVATALAVRVPCVVLDEAVYDVRFGTVAPATATNITGGTITTVTNLTNDPTGVGTLLTRLGTPANLGSGATVAANLSDIEGFADDIPSLPTAAAIADAVWDEDATAHQTQGTFGQAIGDPAADANTIYGAVVTGAAGATIAADIVDIEGKVDDLETRLGTPSDLGSGATVAANLADIEGFVDDIPSLPTAAAIADAVWDESTVGHTTADTFGEQVKTDIDAILVDTGTTLQGELDGIQADTEDIQAKIGTPSDLGSGATVAANLADIEAQTDDIGAAGAGLTAVPYNAAWDAEIQSEVQDALEANNLDHLMKIAVDTDFPTTVHLNSVVGYLADNGTAASFDRTADSLEAIAGAGGGGGLDAQGVRDAIGLAAPNLDTQLGDLPTNAELAAALGTADDATLAAIAALNDLSAADVRTAVGMASANLDTQLDALPTNAELATALAAADDAILAAIAALNNLSAAQVNAEVVDALTVDVIADSTPALGSRPTIAEGVLLATRLLAEKEVAGTTVTVNKEDGVTPALTLTLDDAANPTSISRAT